MGGESRLEELLSLWEGQLAQGRDVPAAELCRDQPELLAELERRIEQLRQLGRLVQKVNFPLSVATRTPQPDLAVNGEQTVDAHTETAFDLPIVTAPPGYEILGELNRQLSGLALPDLVVKTHQIADWNLGSCLSSRLGR
jgi:hypothetical protein